MRSVLCRVCFAIRAFQPGFPLFYARRSRRGGRIDPALLPVSVSVFMRRKRLLKKLFSASRSGGKDRRPPALFHRPHASSAQLRRLLQLRAGDLPCQLPPRIPPPLHGPLPSVTGITPNRTRRAMPPSSAVTYARRCRRSIRTGQPSNAANGPSSTCHVPSS